MLRRDGVRPELVLCLGLVFGCGGGDGVDVTGDLLDDAAVTDMAAPDIADGTVTDVLVIDMVDAVADLPPDTLPADAVADPSGEAPLWDVSTDPGEEGVSDDAAADDGALDVPADGDVAASNADLAGLVLSSGTLSPSFAAVTTTYASWVHEVTTSITVTPITADAMATVTVNGNEVASGSPSASIPLDEGSNTITIVVTAGDGETTQTYTIAMNRKHWVHPASLSAYVSPDVSPTGDYAIDRLSVDLADHGEVIIGWRQPADSGDPEPTYRAFKREYRNGVWSQVTGTAPSSFLDHSVLDTDACMDDSGNAIVAWAQSDGTDVQMYLGEYRGTAWVRPDSLTDDRINPKNSADVSAPQIAMDHDGNAIVVYAGQGMTEREVFKSEYRSGVWAHSASYVNNVSGNDGPVDTPQVAMDDDGNAVIVWAQADGGLWDVMKAEYRNGAWKKPTQLSHNLSPDHSHAYAPKVAMDADGNAIIVWMQLDSGAKKQIFKSEYRQGLWTNPTSIVNNISPDGQDAFDPEVDMDDQGNAIIAWTQVIDGITKVRHVFVSEYR